MDHLLLIVIIFVNFRSDTYMKSNKILQYAFGSIKHCFDLITIGPYANRVAKSVSLFNRQSLQILTIEEQNTIVEPCLFPIDSPIVNVQQNNSEFSSVERGVGVAQINPDRSYLVLKNGNKYHYKQLVYSGNVSDWKGHNQRLSQAKLPKYEHSVYTDLDYNMVQQLYSKKYGSIVFVVPKNGHFGYENYIMMLLQSKIKKNIGKNTLGAGQAKITVLCQGSTLSHNEAYSNLLEKLLKQRNIKLIKNTQYTVDFKKKLFKLNNNQQVKFNEIFQYLPLKAPQILSQSKINPFQVDKQTLDHNKYDNIHILGNIVNNDYSLLAMNEMSKIVTKNLMYKFLGIRKRALYKGYSSFNLWLSKNECIHIQTDYNNAKFKSMYGRNQLQRYLIALHKSMALHFTVDSAINQSCQSFSFFNKPQIINTKINQKQQNKTNLNSTSTH